MEKKYITYGAVAVVGVALVALLSGGMSKGAPEQVKNRGSETAVQGKPESTFSSGETTYQSLLSSGVPQRCDVTTTDVNGNSTGVVLVAGGKMRGDFTSSTNSKAQIKSSLIVKDGMTYVWSDNSPIGIKTPVVQSASTDTATKNDPANMNQKVNVVCKTWDADEGAFVPPESISFQSMEDMMKGMMPEGMKMEM